MHPFSDFNEYLRCLAKTRDELASFKSRVSAIEHAITALRETLSTDKDDDIRVLGEVLQEFREKVAELRKTKEELDKFAP